MKPKKRAVLNDILSRKPDKPLYHYTTQTGLLGIIATRTIWATHTQYLNDRREFLHAVDLVRSEIERLLQEEASSHSGQPARKKVLLRMQEAVSESMSPQTTNICVCSFSEESDSLSQWRAYGGSSGFAVGFPSEVLIAATERLKWSLAPCLYDATEQRDLVRALVEEVLEDNLSGEIIADDVTENATSEDRFLSGVGGGLLSDLFRYAPILKDHSFSEEREWRIISRPLSCHREGFAYREGRSLLIPYYKFPLWESNQKLRLHEVVIGPTRDAERSRSSVTSFLVSRNVMTDETEGIFGPDVRISRVPYRDW